MRILVLVHEYPPVGGGGGRVAQDLCEGYAARGHAVKVITAHWKDLARSETIRGVEITRLDSGRAEPFRAGMRAMLGYVWSAFWAGLRCAREWKPDVAHVHFAVPGGPPAWALRLFAGLPYVLTVHLGDVPGGTPEKTGRWFRWVMPFTPPIWRSAAAVVAVSQYTRSLALKHYPVPVQVIHNGVDLRALDTGVLCPHTPPRVTFAGRFVSQKNPLQVVRSLAEVRDLPWHCTLAGDGPLRPAVEAEIAHLGLRDRFTLTGWVEPAQVLDVFRQSDILFMPSLSEGLPVVGVQALALGLALVVSQAGGWVDLVEPGRNGRLLPPDSAAGFASALRELLSDPQKLLAFRQESRVLAASFDLDTIISQYEQVLEGACRSK